METVTMTVVVIEPISSGITYLNAAQELGIDLYVFSTDEGECSIEGTMRHKAKEIIKIDTSDFQSQLSKIVELKTIKAILPGVEYAVPMAAQLGHSHAKNFLEYTTAQTVRNKFKFREKLTHSGLSDIKYALISYGKEIDLPTGFKFPAVVKPVDMAGSMSVKKVTDFEELLRTVDAIWKAKPNDIGFYASGDLIVEEYITGQEYSVEGIVHTDGTITFASITEKLLGPEPYFVEIGHIVGNQYDNQFSEHVFDYAEKVIRTLELNIGPFHLELRVTPQGKAVAIELAARLPGDNIVELIKLATNFDLAQAVLSEYLDLPYLPSIEKNMVSAIAFIPQGNHRFFKGCSGLEQLLEAPECVHHHFYYETDDELACNHDWTSRLGYIILRSESGANIRNLVKLIHEQVEVI